MLNVKVGDEVAEVGPIAPQPGSRNGWHYKTYKRIGCTEVLTPRKGGADLYGVYGIRQAGQVWEVFIQHAGRREDDGSVYGQTLLASSCDLEPYFWFEAGEKEITLFEAETTP